MSRLVPRNFLESLQKKLPHNTHGILRSLKGALVYHSGMKMQNGFFFRVFSVERSLLMMLTRSLTFPLDLTTDRAPASTERGSFLPSWLVLTAEKYFKTKNV